MSKSSHVYKKTNTPIGAWKCNFPTLGNYDRPTDATDRRPINGVIGKLHFQQGITKEM